MICHQGEGLVGKRDKNRGSGDKAALRPCGRCFFKSIFSMAASSGHSSGKKKRLGGFKDLCSVIA